MADLLIDFQLSTHYYPDSFIFTAHDNRTKIHWSSKYSVFSS